MIKFRTHDYIERKVYVVQFFNRRFSVGVSKNKRSYTFTYGRMIDDILYTVDYFWSFEV